MGKSWRADAKNAKWRRAKMDRERQKNGGRKPEYGNGDQKDAGKEHFSPFDIPIEEHESYA